jgi:hypothetical protein
MYTRPALLTTLVCVFLTFCAVAPANAQCSGNNSNCQIILSGTALPASPNPPCTPWGLWVWSQPANNNYGNDGHGAMYFYAIEKGEAIVEASNVVLNGNYVTESVSGSFKPSGVPISCTLSAHQTSPGKGILDSMSCTVGTNSCTASDIPITVDMSNAKK